MRGLGLGEVAEVAEVHRAVEARANALLDQRVRGLVGLRRCGQGDESAVIVHEEDLAGLVGEEGGSRRDQSVERRLDPLNPTDEWMRFVVGGVGGQRRQDQDKQAFHGVA